MAPTIPLLLLPLQLDSIVLLKWGFLSFHVFHEDWACNWLWAVECITSHDIPVLRSGLMKCHTVLSSFSESNCNHVNKLERHCLMKTWGSFILIAPADRQLRINMREAILDQYSAKWPQMP